MAAEGPKIELFVEPFAGGASTTLRLLGTGMAQRAIVADADPLVSAFWYACAFNTEDLVEAMHREPVTLERWDYWHNTRPSGPLSKALKCLFLNRTSFSGVLNQSAGPIGGRSQTGPYKLGCRWYPAALEDRIRAVGDLAATGRLLDVWCCPWPMTVKRAADEYLPLLPDCSALFYYDPPYVTKGERLYAEPFNEADHRELAAYLVGAGGTRWLLSYDDHPLVREMYPPVWVKELEHSYSAKGARKQATRRTELLISPENDRAKELQC